MKTGVKTALILAAVLLATGVILIAAVLFHTNFQWKTVFPDNSVEKIYPVNEAFTDIQIQTNTDNVRFERAEDGVCRIECRESDRIIHTVTVKDDVLTVTQNTNNKEWYKNLVRINWEEWNTVIYLPETVYGSLTVSTDTGDIGIPQDFTFGEVKLSSDTGDISFFAAAQNGLSAESDTGDVAVEGVNPEKLAVSTDTGTISLSSVQTEGSVEVKTHTGRITFSNVRCGSVAASATTGDVQMNDLIVSGEMNVKTDTGDVAFSRCDASSLEIYTDTGDVSGTLLSDKVFITQTNTGKINVPETLSGGSCKITTDTGDIRITIE